MAELDKIVESLSKLSVLEAAELVKMLEETMGRFAAAPWQSRGALSRAPAKWKRDLSLCDHQIAGPRRSSHQSIRFDFLGC